MIERRSSSGVRISGDDYQHLVAWTEAVPALYAQAPWKTLELEASVPTSLDDVVIQSAEGKWRYVQAKYAADAQRLLAREVLTEVDGQASRSLLRKLHAGWMELKTRGAVGSIELVTNRVVDPGDPILRLLDARDDSLRRIIQDPPDRGPVSSELTVWASHLGVHLSLLLEFLKCFRVRAGATLSHLNEIAAAHMTAAGLVSTEAAVRQGIDAMRMLVTNDVRRITPIELSERTAHMARASQGHDALVVVEAIDDDHAAASATHRIDWRDRYPQVTVDQRIVPIGGRDAFKDFWKDLCDLHKRLDDARIDRPLARGTLRLASWFALGYALRAVDGFRLTIQRGPYLTRSDTRPSDLVASCGKADLATDGGDIAVALCVSAEIEPAVRTFLEVEHLSVRTLLRLTVAPRPSSAALQSDADAAAVVAAARDAIRPYVGLGRVHLFLACPAGVAAMLGHTWHRLPPVTVYEHVAAGYLRAFEFD